MEKKTNNLVIFDVCNTFVNTNSTFSYVDFLIKKWIKPYYNIIFHSKIFGLFFTFFNICFRKDLKIIFVKKYFKWLKEYDLKNISSNFFLWYYWKINHNMKNILKNRIKDSKCIFLSASINQPIDFLKNKFWLEWFSSVLETRNGIYTWKTNISLRWNKEYVFQSWLFNLWDFDNTIYYTDNIDDVWVIKYLNDNSKIFTVNIIPYSNKIFWENFFSTNEIRHEFTD